MKTENDVKAWLEKRIEAAANPAVWGNLLEERYVQEVIDGQDDGKGLLKRYRKLCSLVSEARRAHQVPQARHTDAPPDRRQFLISRVLAREAANEPRVKEFRRKYLPAGLLTRDGIRPWLDAQQAEGRPASLYLAYVGPDGWTAREPVKSRAAYDLLQIGEYLKRYGWEPPEAVTFVLTGEIPYLGPVRATVGFASAVLPSGFNYSRSSVTLTIDLATPPATVAQVYRDLRRQYRQRRYRPLTAPVALLVEFVLSHPELKLWREKMKVWNQQNPNRPYDNVTRFARDYNRALVNLLR